MRELKKLRKEELRKINGGRHIFRRYVEYLTKRYAEMGGSGGTLTERLSAGSNGAHR